MRQPPNADMLAWMNKLVEREYAFPDVGDESAAAHDCKREGLTVLCLRHRKTGKTWPWHKVKEICPDDQERSHWWFSVGETLTELGWEALAEYG